MFGCKLRSDFVQQQDTICDFSHSDSWTILSPIEQSIKRKIEKVGTPLKEWDIQINYGIKTGFNEAFIISTEKREEILANCQTEEEQTRTAELIRPILRGRDIKRYGYVENGLFLINTHNGLRGKLPRIDINDYPAVKAHLDQYWDKISVRSDKGDTPYNLRNCAYLEDFSKPKIVYMEIQTDNEKEGYPFPCFSYDNSNKIVLNTAYIISSNTEDVRFILGVINSKMGRFLTKLYVSQLQERQFRMLAQYVKNFPIPKLPQYEIDYIIKAVEYNI
ncbi:MAG: class I SAM-dependent DNA methyltransferase, partial [Prevotella sp.]|nr:class I SAM-dependent DNA methyltransferase [Prevotella sp.]